MTMSPEDVKRRLRAELDGVPVPERPWAAVRLGLIRQRARRRRRAAAGAGAAPTAGENVTFSVTHFNFHPGVLLNFYEPGSSSVYVPCFFTANSQCSFTTRVSGVWSMVLDAASAGSLTLEFANQAPVKVLTPGIPVTTTIRFEGQEARYTFAAKQQPQQARQQPLYRVRRQRQYHLPS